MRGGYTARDRGLPYIWFSWPVSARGLSFQERRFPTKRAHSQISMNGVNVLFRPWSTQNVSTTCTVASQTKRICVRVPRFGRHCYTRTVHDSYSPTRLRSPSYTTHLTRSFMHWSPCTAHILGTSCVIAPDCLICAEFAMPRARRVAIHLRR